MELELLPPGVEYGGEAELRPEVLRIARDGLQCLGYTLEEQVEQLRFVAQGQWTQDVGEREDQVPVTSG
jgi:hypothetical protein